jgi:Flp pilus assembly protein TadG
MRSSWTYLKRACTATRNAAGQALVEFALLATLLITLMLAAFDFGLAFYANLVVKSAVSEAAYYYAQNPYDWNGTEQRARLELRALSNASGAQITSTILSSPACDPTLRTMTRNVIITYTHEFIFAPVVPVPTLQLSARETFLQSGTCREVRP